MRIKEYRRLSLYGTAVSIAVAVAGGALMLYGMNAAGIALLIIGIAGAVVSSTAIRLYGKMTADAFFKGKDVKDE